MIDDFERCYAAIRAQDPRFDGVFTFAVVTTGIHCRPSCPARTPQRHNVRLFPTTAAAQQQGFRPCRRCRPDAAPGSPDWDVRGDLAARALRAITDGTVDRHGVRGLADQLGYSPRHLHRLLTAEVGAGPRELARAQRTRTALLLLEQTDLPVAQVAYAAGFGSVRQCNDTLRARLGRTPTELRASARTSVRHGDALELHLPARQPFDGAGLLAHLAVRAAPHLDEVGDGWHRRSLTLPHGHGIVTLRPDDGGLRATVHLDDPRDLPAAVARVRRLGDLDADPTAIDEHLARDPALAPLVAARPGLRSPAATDAVDAAVRTVLAQQVSVATAAALLGRLAAGLGRPTTAVGAVDRCLPIPVRLAAADAAKVGIPRARAATLRRLLSAIEDGTVDLGPAADREDARAACSALPGLGPWSVEVLALRGLHDPDAFPATDLALRRAAASLGLPDEAAPLRRHAERWRPWRAYAASHLWARAADLARSPRSSPAHRAA